MYLFCLFRLLYSISCIGALKCEEGIVPLRPEKVYLKFIDHKVKLFFLVQ